MGCSAPVQGRAAKQVSIPGQVPVLAPGTQPCYWDTWSHIWPTLGSPTAGSDAAGKPCQYTHSIFSPGPTEKLSKTKNNDNEMAGYFLLLLSIFMLAQRIQVTSFPLLGGRGLGLSSFPSIWEEFLCAWH